MAYKVLFVGDDTYEIYTRAFYKAAMQITGVDASYFHYGAMNLKKIQNTFIKKAEFHFRIGPDIRKVNRRLIKMCQYMRYDIVFLYSAVLVREDTVQKIKRTGAYIAVYCNDDPFSTSYKRYYWKNLRDSIQYADIAYSYRKSNIKGYQKYGAGKIRLLLPYYIASRNYYVEDAEINADVPDVVFVGHRERDGREKYIKALLNRGVQVGLNEGWDGFEPGNPYISRVSGSFNEYNHILNKAKIAIVFLSGRNHDTYTRRCFEIPMVKTLMLAPYTNDLANFFRDGVEAVFYTGVEDFVDKVCYYLEHEKERKQVAENGYQKIKNGKFEVKDRVKQIVEDYEQIRGKANYV